MNPIVLLTILPPVSGYGFYDGSPYNMYGGGIVVLILLVVIVLALMRRL